MTIGWTHEQKPQIDTFKILQNHSTRLEPTSEGEIVPSNWSKLESRGEESSSKRWSGETLANFKPLAPKTHHNTGEKIHPTRQTKGATLPERNPNSAIGKGSEIENKLKAANMRKPSYCVCNVKRRESTEKAETPIGTPPSQPRKPRQTSELGPDQSEINPA